MSFVIDSCVRFTVLVLYLLNIVNIVFPIIFYIPRSKNMLTGFNVKMGAGCVWSGKLFRNLTFI